MKSNHQARHLLGLNYKLSRQKKWCSKATKKLPLTISMLRAANAAVVNFQLSDDKTPSAKRDGVLRQSHASHPSLLPSALYSARCISCQTDRLSPRPGLK